MLAKHLSDNKLNKKLRLIAIGVLLVGSALWQLTATGHHLTSVRFNTDTDTSITGVLTRVDWKNPHVYLYLEGLNANSELVTWEIEGPPPAGLRRAGWSRETLAIGSRVTVNGNPGRNPEDNIFLFETIETEENEVLGLMQSFAALPGQDAAVSERATSLAGTWGTGFSYEANVKLIVASQLPLTEKGRQAVESYVEVTDNPALDCSPGTTPPATMLVPDIKSIEIRDDVVLLRAEHESIDRTIYLNKQSHDGAEESVFGHSIGYWEGENQNTLVIETARFSSHRQGNATSLPSGPDKQLIEKLTLSEDGSKITYHYELSDPEYLVGTVSDQIEWAYRPDLSYEPLICDVENARKFAL